MQADFPDLRILDAPVSGGGHTAAAGALLAKDVDILVDVTGIADSAPLGAADWALDLMGVHRADRM